VSALFELERWRERQFNEHQRAQIIDRMDQHVVGMSELAGMLSGVESSVGAIEGDLARLVAVTDEALPAIVEHIALVAKRLGGIEEMLASPTETAATELFRRGSHALASATELSQQDSPELASEWLEEATSDLSRAVETYPYHFEAWYLLGIALERQGSTEAAAEALSRCARFSAAESPEFSAWALLISAGLYRRLKLHDKAADLLHKFLKPLDLCAEIHLSLAVMHNENDQLIRALELAPMLAADARAEGVASAEAVAADLCQQDDGPVTRLRSLEDAARNLAQSVQTVGLEDIDALPGVLSLPQLGVDALLAAEANLPVIVAAAGKLLEQVAASLQNLEGGAAEARTRAAKAESEARKYADTLQTVPEIQDCDLLPAHPRFDGFYQESSYPSSTHSFLRFYSSGEVIDVTTTGTALQIAAWFLRGHEGLMQGEYQLQGAAISFTTRRREIGAISYSGRIVDGAARMYLEVHHINGHRSSRSYDFTPVGPPDDEAERAARLADQRAHRSALEAQEGSRRTALEAQEKSQLAGDALDMPLQALTTAIQIAAAPRHRIVPQAHPQARR